MRHTTTITTAAKRTKETLGRQIYDGNRNNNINNNYNNHNTINFAYVLRRGRSVLYKNLLASFKRY